jgi:O-antigen ligase
MIFFAFFLAYLLKQIEDLCKIILFSLIICYFVLLTDSIYQFFTGFNFFGYKATDRISSFFGDKFVMGSFISRTLPIILSILFFVKIKFNEFFKALIVFIAGLLIYLSAERLAFAYYLVILTFYVLINFSKKKLLTTVIIFFFGLLTLFYIKPNSFDRLFFQSVKQSKQTSYYGFSYRHELHFITALNLFNDSKLLGHGLKSFRYLCGLKNYAPTEKIILDNTVFSTVTGQVFLLNESNQKNNNFLIIEKNFDNNKLAKILSETNFGEFYLFRKLEEGLYNYKFSNNFNGIYVKHNDMVNKGDPLGFNYEFSNGCNTHPHNIYFEFISELGLIGLIFLLIGLFYILSYIFTALKNIHFKKDININSAFFFSSLGILISIFPLFPSGSFFNNWLSAIFYFNLAFLFYFKKLND